MPQHSCEIKVFICQTFFAFGSTPVSENIQFFQHSLCHFFLHWEYFLECVFLVMKWLFFVYKRFSTRSIYEFIGVGFARIQWSTLYIEVGFTFESALQAFVLDFCSLLAVLIRAAHKQEELMFYTDTFKQLI